MRIPYDAATKKARSRSIFVGAKWLEVGYNPKDVWSVSRLHREHPERADHPTQKPLEIIERMIKASCPPGGVVLDPFMGSGTTALAAQPLRPPFRRLRTERRLLRHHPQQRLTRRTDACQARRSSARRQESRCRHQLRKNSHHVLHRPPDRQRHPPRNRRRRGLPVPDASGFIKLDAMENPYPLPRHLRAELGAPPGRRGAEPLSGAQLRSAESAHPRKHRAYRTGYDVILGNGSDEHISMIAMAVAGRQAPSGDPGARARPS